MGTKGKRLVSSKPKSLEKEAVGTAQLLQVTQKYQNEDSSSNIKRG